jgi:5-methylcytosine-specific restriction endonuclease McrA
MAVKNIKLWHETPCENRIVVARHVSPLDRCLTGCFNSSGDFVLWEAMSKIHPHLKLKQLLDRFWIEFGNHFSGRWTTSQDHRLSLLKRYAEIVIRYNGRSPLSDYRSKFNKIKFRLHPLDDFGYCFVCQKKAQVRHHIIQLQNGGINSHNNILSLCNFCHGLVHPHLAGFNAASPIGPMNNVSENEKRTGVSA